MTKTDWFGFCNTILMDLFISDPALIKGGGGGGGGRGGGGGGFACPRPEATVCN